MNNYSAFCFMLDQRRFRQDHQRAVDLMREKNLTKAGEVFSSLYAQLRMNSYRQRLTKRRFDKVFLGLTPVDVMTLLVNKTACHMNASETRQALDTIKCYKMVGRDFSIAVAPDFDMAMNEVEYYRRSGENVNALRCCERLLKTTLDTYQKAKMYILLYEKMSIYLCQKMYKQSYLLHSRKFDTATNFKRIPVARVYEEIKKNVMFYAYKTKHFVSLYPKRKYR